MIIIIAHHFALHGNFSFPNDIVTVNRLWIQFIQIGEKIGVNVFVLISGYFLVSSKTLKVSKVIKFWLQIFTYSVVIFLIFVLAVNSFADILEKLKEKQITLDFKNKKK